MLGIRGTCVLSVAIAGMVACTGPRGPDDRSSAAEVPAGRSTPSVSVPAQAFVDSVGVNTHLSYPDSAYVDRSAVRTALKDLCIGHVRDNVPERPAASLVDAYRDLALDGVEVLAVTGSLGQRSRLADPDSAVDWLADNDLVPAPVTAVEGPNEWDGRGGHNWADEVVRYQEAFAAAARSRLGAKILLVSPSTARPARRIELGDLSEAVDVASNHDYPSGRPPSAPDAEQMGPARALAGSGADVWTTETGYQTSGREQNGQPSVTAYQQSVYVPRLLAESFAAGIGRTYLYELFDERDPEDADPLGFGLVKADLSRKPAFRSMSRLLCTLSATATPPSAAVGAAPVTPPTVAVDAGDDDVRVLALSGTDGSLSVLLWRDVEAPARPRAAPDKGSATVRLSVDRPVDAVVTADLVTGSGQRLSATTGTAVPVPVADGLVLVQLRPRG